MKAKIIELGIVYFNEGDTVKIGDNWVSNPTPEMLLKAGYKEVIYQTGNGGTYQTDTYIIVETPEVEISAQEKREIAYLNDPVIMWDGKLRTCDFCRGILWKYTVLENTEKYNLLKPLYIEGVEAIQTKYPD